MENTKTNYTTNKTLMDYIQTNIDVHINYLLFLNSFKGLSDKKGFMELAPVIESLRTKLYEIFPYDLVPNNTLQVNAVIVDKLGELLDAINLGEIKAYIGENLSCEDIVNLTTAIFLRKSIAHTSIIEYNCDAPKTKLIFSTIDKMSNKIPSSNLNISGYSFELVSFFLTSLKINADQNKSLIEYIYEYICDAEFINNTSKQDNNEESLNNESDFLRKDLLKCLYVKNNFSLVNLVDELYDSINSLKYKDNKNLIIGKHQ